MKLKFLKDKFLRETSASKKGKNEKSSFQLEDHYKTLAKLKVVTNLTSFDIPLRIYDGLLKFVSRWLSLA